MAEKLLVNVRYFSANVANGSNAPIYAPGIALKPGDNWVEKSLVEEALSIPTIAARFEKGILYCPDVTGSNEKLDQPKAQALGVEIRPLESSGLGTAQTSLTSLDSLELDLSPEGLISSDPNAPAKPLPEPDQTNVVFESPNPTGESTTTSRRTRK